MPASAAVNLRVLGAVAWRLLLLLVLGLLVAQAASAQTRDALRAEQPAQRSAEAGAFLPATESPRTDSQTAYVVALGGYDTARRSAQFEARAQVSILPWLAIRGGPVYTQHPERFRPFLGVRAQVLSQGRQAVDLGFGLTYRPEGFTEAEGEIELSVAAARRVGRLATFANLVYGQDPEAAERDGELRLAALYSLAPSLQAGLDARLRVDLGSEESRRRAEGGAHWDALFGPTASYELGALAMFVQVGLSVVDATAVHYGALGLVGVAGVL